MKYTVVLAALAAAAAAQDLSKIPFCSLSCFLTALPSTGCAQTDFKCACGKAAGLTPSITPCILNACSTDEQPKVFAALSDLCASVGIPINSAPPVGSSTPAGPSPASSPTPPPPPPTNPTTGCASTTTITITRSVAPCSTGPSVGPYPTGTSLSSYPVGTGFPVIPQPPAPPQFKGAASVAKPMALAGAIGMAAMFL